MAREYSQIKSTIWADNDYRALSSDAQHLYFVLLTLPGINLAGVRDWRPKKLVPLSSGKTEQIIRAAAAELDVARFVVLDEETEEIMVRSFVRHDGVLKSPNIARGSALAWAAIGSEKLRSAYAAEVKRAAEEDPTLPGLSRMGEVLAYETDQQPNQAGRVPEGFDLGSGNPSGTLPGEFQNRSPLLSPLTNNQQPPTECASADADDASETGASAEPPATPDPTDTPTNPQPPKQKTPRKTNPNGDALLEGFDDWWATYPRKTSKQAARRAYAAAVRGGTSPATLLAGLKAALPDLTDREARFVPYPATWLNGGAWEDEPAAAPGSVRVARRGTALAREGVVCDDMRTYRGWLSPQPVSRDGVVIHDPLGSLGPPVVGGDHDWWAEQGVPAVAAS